MIDIKKLKTYMYMALFMAVCCLSVVRGQEIVIPGIDTAYVSWSPTGQEIAVSQGENVNIFDVVSGESIQSFSGTGRYYAAPIWSPDGERIGFGRSDNFEIWSNIRSTPTLEGLIPDSSGGHANAWSPDSQIIAMSHGDYIEFWDATTYTLIESYLSEFLVGRALSLEWNYSSDTLLIGGLRRVQILNIETKVSDFNFSIEPFVNPQGFYINPSARSAWSPSEEQIAIVSDDAVRVLNLANYVGQESVTLAHASFFYGHQGQVYSLSWHPGGNYLATSGEDSTIRIWDIVTGQQVHIIELPGTVIRSIAWSPDGSQLAYGSATGEAQVVIVPSDSILPPPSIMCNNPNPIPDTAALSSEITAGNNAGAPYIICLENSTYTLDTVNNSSNGDNGLPVITGDITIIGNGATITRDAAAPAFRFFNVSSSGSLTLENLTLSNGSSDTGGGAILNNGTLTVTNSTLSDNAVTVDDGAPEG